MNIFLNHPDTGCTLSGLDLTKRVIFGLCLAVLFVFSFTQWAVADELSELNEQMKAMQKQMMEMQEKIKALEEEKARRIATPAQIGEDKVTELEQEVEFLQDQQDSIFDKLQKMIDFHLYVTLEFENFENSNSSFDARQIELFFGMQLTDRLKAFSEIEFERTAVTSDGRRQGEVEVEQGWLEYYVNDYFVPRFGVILVPFGKYNLAHFAPFRDLTDPPL